MKDVSRGFPEATDCLAWNTNAAAPGPDGMPAPPLTELPWMRTWQQEAPWHNFGRE